MDEPLSDAPISDPTGAETDPVDWARRVRLVVGALVAGAFVLFVVQNTQQSDVNFLGWTVSLPQSLLMIACAIAGVVIWWVAGKLSRTRD